MLSTNETSPSPDNDGFFSTLRWCVLLSFAALMLAAASRQAPWLVMLGGGAPLVWYHWFYLARRARTHGLSQTAIDSVYYFGFLITIAALGVSALSLALSGGKEPMSNIAFQFGLGLLATGYAVLARMHLSSITTLVDDASPEAVLDRYVQRSRELVMNVEMASTQFHELATNLMTKSQDVAETARSTTERAMLEVARVFDEQLRSTLASANHGLADLRALVSETSFVQEREALVRSVKTTLDSVNALNRSLEEFALRSGEGARTAAQTAQSTEALNATVSLFREQLERIGGADGQMVASAKTLAQAQENIAQTSGALGDVVRELEEMSGTVASTGPTFKSIRSLAQKAGEQMSALVESAERLDDATHRIERSASATGRWADGLDRAGEALPRLSERAEGLEKRLDSLTASATNVEHQLQSLPRPTQDVIALSAELKAALSTVQQVLALVSAEAQSLAAHNTKSVEAIGKAGQLAQEVATLQGTSEAINQMLDKLTGTLERLHGNLSGSTQTLQTAMTSATTALEADVQRSSDAARLFVEKLTHVAQGIIDRTKGTQPA